MTRRAATRIAAARTALAVALLAVGLGALFGCSRGGLVNMWRDPQYGGPLLSNLYVVVLKPDPARRRLLEDAFVEKLGERGVRARASYRDYETALPDTIQVLEAVQAAGYDGVVMVATLPSAQDQLFVPGYVTREAQTHYDRWTGRYYTVWVEVTHPGYTESETVARHLVDVWATKDGGRLVWSGVSERENPNDFGSVSKSITSHVVPELSEQKLIPEKR